MEKYKNLYITVLTVFTLICSACSSDESSNAIFTDDEIPRIFFENTWLNVQSIDSNTILSFNTTVSPNDGATYKWTLDGVIISQTKNLEYLVTQDPGVYTLTFEVNRNEVVNTRTAQLTVN